MAEKETMVGESDMEEPWRLLIKTLHTKVEDAIQTIEGADGQDMERKRTMLKVINQRFTEAVNCHLEKLSSIEVKNFIDCQIKAEMLCIPCSSIANERPKVHTKLPQLELCKFHGNVLHWTEFWDRFQSTIDSQQLCGADKLAYLQASLGQEALTAIKGLDTTNANYAVAVDILKDRYGKKGIILDAHYQALQNIKTAGNTPQECREVLDQLETHLRILKSMGEDVNHNNLRTIILNKFPNELIYELRNKVKLEEENIDSIRMLLEHQISAHVATSKPPSFTTETFVQHSRRQSIAHRTKAESSLKRKAASLVTTAPSKKIRKRTLPCVFCAGEHYNDACPRSVKERKSLLKGKCYRCFSSLHQVKDCTFKRRCYHCSGDHNSALCMNPKGKPYMPHQGFTHTYLGSGSNTLLQTAIIRIKHDGYTLRCRALLDTGSSRSYLTTKLVEKLNLPKIEDTRLTIYTFGTSKPTEVESPLTEVEVVSQNANIRMKVNMMPYITSSVDVAPRKLVDSLSKHLRNRLADDGSLGTNIDILIGNDYYHSFVTDERIQCNEHLFLINTLFGLIWSGHQENVEISEPMSIITYVQGEPVQLSVSNLDLPLRNKEVHRLWDLETIGIIDCPKTSRDDEAVEEFYRTVNFENNRYWIKWPWCRLSSELNDNFGLAFGRLRGLCNRLDQCTLKKYTEILKEQLDSGVIEEIQNNKVSHAVHYLPHHHVVKEGKLRLVYDASSKVKGQYSLNECLYRGPLLLENLIGIIIRMRTYKYGITADVEKAFLQIGIQEIDRDVTRFLWLKDLNQALTENNLVHLRFCRVPFGIGCSPFILAMTLKHHLMQINTPVCNQIAKDIYVDNLVTGANDTKECLEFYKETNKVFNDISMNMRQWYTNNPELRNFMHKNKSGKEIRNVPLLGVKWDVDNDTISLKTEIRNIALPVTKRKLLAFIASVYDPCGYATPLLVGAKLLLQDMWKLGLDWDEPLPSQHQEEFQAAVKQMQGINKIIISRWYGIEKPLNNDEVSLELHCFTDASEKAYAAAVYIRIIQGNMKKVSLILSKSRLSPIKNAHMNTIPRAELLGVLVGSRLLQYAQLHLNLIIDRKYLWTDSQIVLHWLNSRRVLPPFVTNRINEIKKNKNVEYKYVSTSDNPADLATRPCKEALEETKWFEGPQYLTEGDEVRINTSLPIVTLLGGEGLREERVENNHTNNDQRINTTIGGIIEVQKVHFPSEYQGKVTDLSRSLRIFKDEDGVLRCEGRFKNADLLVGQKFPILLPTNSEFTRSVVEKIHKTNYHVGVSHTLALVREKYWIVRGRSLIQKVLRKCIQCRKYGGGPYKLPPMPSLPSERVSYNPPFTHTGIDYLGPLYTTNGDKRWVCLYTCLSIRAVHLEVVYNLSTEECSLALRRFIATRGLPQVITSDNASQFKLMSEILTSKYCIENEIQWKFIPELAPWFGGLYERLVGLIKHCLKRSLEKHLLSDQQLSTIIKEIEAVLNTRPLTYVGSDVEKVLTPADFLRVGGVLMTAATGEELLEPATEIKRMLIDGWKRGQMILEEWVQMFKNQYLPLLRERSDRHREPRVKIDKVPKVGDLVQIKDDINRTEWKVGKISSTVISPDGQIRVARVKVGEKEFTRSIAHLYPLELDEEDIQEVFGQTQPVREKVQEVTGQKIPDIDVGNDKKEDRMKERLINRRRAATQAREKLAEWTKFLFAK